MRYEIYLEGCSNPVYIYQSPTWLSKRLMRLCEESSVSNCTVICIAPSASELSTRIRFERTPRRWGWSASHGIPTSEGSLHSMRNWKVGNLMNVEKLLKLFHAQGLYAHAIGEWAVAVPMLANSYNPVEFFLDWIGVSEEEVGGHHINIGDSDLYIFYVK